MRNLSIVTVMILQITSKIQKWPKKTIDPKFRITIFFTTDYKDAGLALCNLWRLHLYANVRLFLIDRKIDTNFFFNPKEYKEVKKVSSANISNSYIVKKKKLEKKYFLKRIFYCNKAPEIIATMVVNQYPSLIKIKGYHVFRIREFLKYFYFWVKTI